MEFGIIFEFDEQIGFGKRFFKLLIIPLDEASGNNQFLFVFGHLENGVDALLFARGDEPAGVDDDDIGFIRIVNQSVTGIIKHA